MIKRTTSGTIKRDNRMSRLNEMMIERQRIEALIDSLLGCYVRLKDGKIAEVIGISDSNPLAVRIEWLAGDELGESELYETQPTSDLPKHVIDFGPAIISC